MRLQHQVHLVAEGLVLEYVLAHAEARVMVVLADAVLVAKADVALAVLDIVKMFLLLRLS